jgi:hypothetical protein
VSPTLLVCHATNIRAARKGIHNRLDM